MRMLPLLLLGASLLPRAGLAQSHSPVLDALRHQAERAQRNLVGAAESMPADKFGFKPTPAQMSFGELVLHVAGANDFMCSTISGTKAPAEPEVQPTAKKAALIERVNRSFAFCTTALAKVGDGRHPAASCGIGSIVSGTLARITAGGTSAVTSVRRQPRAGPNRARSAAKTMAIMAKRYRLT